MLNDIAVVGEGATRGREPFKIVYESATEGGQRVFQELAAFHIRGVYGTVGTLWASGGLHAAGAFGHEWCKVELFSRQLVQAAHDVDVARMRCMDTTLPPAERVCIDVEFILRVAELESALVDLDGRADLAPTASSPRRSQAKMNRPEFSGDSAAWICAAAIATR